VTLFLVRHGSAGHRASWEGEQRIRPLDERGRRQARALVELLEGEPIERILSSPAFRCVQTVEPLAAARGLEIELREELTEERQADEGAALVRALLGDHVVVCGHRGLQDAVLERPTKWRKGSVLVLAANGSVERTLAPPD
jgi:8-oxo-dGTP diphosphatase